MKKEKTTQESIKEAIIVVALIGIIGVCVLKITRDYGAFEGMTTILPQDITFFKIYPRIGGPTGIPIEFLANDSIVAEFLQSLRDLEAYHSTPTVVMSHDDTWFVEIATKKEKILQMKCSLNYTPNIVIVHIGTARYQSRLLVHWYQKYSRRWLNPDNPQLKQTK